MLMVTKYNNTKEFSHDLKDSRRIFKNLDSGDLSPIPINIMFIQNKRKPSPSTSLSASRYHCGTEHVFPVQISKIEESLLGIPLSSIV